jgi:hypothetical protein
MSTNNMKSRPSPAPARPTDASLEEDAIVLRQADDRGLAPLRLPFARQPLEQPRAERVDGADAGHVDRSGAGLRGFAGDAIDERLQFAGIGGNPGASCRDLKTIALKSTGQQDFAHGIGSLRLRRTAKPGVFLPSHALE